MYLPALALILGAVFVWALVSGRTRSISAPIYFVAVGLLLAEGVKLLQIAPDPHVTKLMAEVTLVWVLFADASRVRFSTLRDDAGRYVRLLGIGLPVTIVLGTVAGTSVLGLSLGYALLLGAALAPTDAALGATVMTDQRVPYRMRQTLNVESGLNDGIATPVVTTALAMIVLQSGSPSDFGLATALLGLPVGVVVGLAIGIAGGSSLRIAHRRGWSSEAIAGPAVLALALLAFVVATLLLANGYVAAFVAGIAFGASAGRGGKAEVYYVEQTCGLASMLCWLLFGALAVPTLAADWSWRILLYAVVSLTVVRMIPVALALLGARLDWRSVIFLGWFGPRGLASVVFALIAAEDLHGIPGEVDVVVATIGLTVLLSVLLHGLTASPLVAWLAAASPVASPAETESATSAEVQVRHLVEPPRTTGAARPPD
ncbi:MAG TPA: cation:proton antiporter [Microlunatus sp.]